MSKTIKNCRCCKHLLSERIGIPPVFCKAYPQGDGISIDILSGQKHHDHLFGDEKEKVCFESREEDGADVIEATICERCGKPHPFNTQLIKKILGRDADLYSRWLDLYNKKCETSSFPLERTWMEFKELYSRDPQTGQWAYKSVSETIAEGGPGSGNFGHAGIPGEVGGSAPGSGAFVSNSDPSSPDQNTVPGEGGQRLTDYMLGHWAFASSNSNIASDVAAKFYGISATDLAIKLVSKEVITRIADKMYRDDSGDYHSEFSEISNKEHFLELAEKQIRSEFDRRFSERLNPDTFNREALDKSILHLKSDAAEVSDDGVDLYRGLQISKSLHKEISDSIRDKGYYDLPVTVLSSYTESKELADKFALYGEGGKKGRGMSGGGNASKSLTYSIKQRKQDVWLHYKQKQWQAWTKRTNPKFNIGGKTQREVVHGNSTGFVRLTRENTDLFDR